MKITGFYVRPTKKHRTRGIMTPEKARKLARFCGSVFIAIGSSTLPAYASGNAIGKAALSTFGPGGPGMVIIQLMLIACVGWLAGYICQAAGKGQIAGMIHVASTFSCIAIVAGVALKAINAVGEFLN